MKIIRVFAAAFACMALCASADVSVEDVKCSPRTPWNGLVDIEYTIACDNTDADIYVNPVGFNLDTGLTVFPSHFSGDGADSTVKPGTLHMVWDATADLGDLFSSSAFQIKIYAGEKLSRYIVIDISGGPEAETYPIRRSVAGPDLSDDTCRTTEIWMRLVCPGTFMMGSSEDELGHNVYTHYMEDLHKVAITKPFYIGVFTVTQRQWELVKGDRPSYFTSLYEGRPVENAYIRDIGVFQAGPIGGTASDSFIGIMRLKNYCGGFGLPTESQWEYACRAGTQTAFNTGDELTTVAEVGTPTLNTIGRHFGNGYADGSVNPSSTNTTAIVGCYRPNAIGLYDMHGNVDEICCNYGRDHLGFEDQIDPFESDFWNRNGTLVVRGGSWIGSVRGNRSSVRWIFNYGNGSRDEHNNYTGFRLFCQAECLQ